MPLGPVRPRFNIVARGAVDQCIRRLVDAAEDPSSQCVSRVLGKHVDITVDRAIRRRWSPCVQLDLNPADDTATTVHGLIGPHPNKWTLYLAINAAIALSMLFALGFALVQLSLDQRPWAIWIVAAGVPCLAFMYALSQIGRARAAPQTVLLMDLVESALDIELSDRLLNFDEKRPTPSRGSLD